MNRPLRHLAAASVLALSSSAALAQGSGWSTTLDIYLFTPETRTGIGATESELSFSDALENLDLAFMGTVAVSNGRWSFLGDYMMTDLSFGQPVQGQAVSTLNSELKTELFSGYAGYRVYEDPSVSVDLAAGFRWFRTRTKLTGLDGNGAVVVGRSVDDSWVDPVIGVRLRFAIAERWGGTVVADYGGVQSDRETWQVLLTADYRINDNWTARFGYRQISVDNVINGTPFSFDQSGPVFGVSYRF
ncbi:outer membrane beta-barrel protein [Sedimentitalea sp. JM2-8]|uniref:Outer membrane beta-barrel protein n=1 Tax=Sedimentitalea xiamensis TaxID=3050037 RepID=A0ABT7FE01_9RHOB|nr:outer membrane beta-barrel protein [Sedimentitalea xiamensis]MDK3073218.1 outer membrane beta-barrel protein [Sedimentitalea xiamensis]